MLKVLWYAVCTASIWPYESSNLELLAVLRWNNLNLYRVVRRSRPRNAKGTIKMFIHRTIHVRPFTMSGVVKPTLVGRKGLTSGFTPLVTGRHCLLAASSRAREHDRKRRLQKGFRIFYRNAAAVVLWARARERAAGEYRRKLLLKGVHR